MKDARQFVSSFDRPNIRYTIVEKKDATAQLLRFVTRESTPARRASSTASRAKRVEEIAATLVQEGRRALPYHAGLDSAVRQTNQDRFSAATRAW